MSQHTKRLRRRAKADKQRVRNLPHVTDKHAAWALFWERLGYAEYIDNHRSAFVDDAADHAKYGDAMRAGCCGSFDMSVLIDDREFVMGCNYGH